MRLRNIFHHGELILEIAEIPVLSFLNSQNLRSLREHLHQYPELSWKEYETSALIAENLSHFGLEPQLNKAGGTGIWVDIQGNKPGKRISWRADIDALPIKEELDKPYASKYFGIGHECGHDVHTTIALGICKKLVDHREKIHGTIRVIFQPAEESQPSGAPAMIEDGAIQNIEEIYALHVDPSLQMGTIAANSGPVNAGFKAFIIHIKAPQPLHSARPHSGPNAMLAAIALANQLSSLVGRVIDPRNPAVLAVTGVHGGDALNVVPTQTRVQGTIRTAHDSDMNRIMAEVERSCISIARMFNLDVEPHFTLGAPSVINNDALAENARMLIQESSTFTLAEFIPSMGGEDFGFYTQIIPAVLFRLGISNSKETSFPLHSNRFDIDSEILLPAVEFFSDFLLNTSKK